MNSSVMVYNNVYHSIFSVNMFSKIKWKLFEIKELLSSRLYMYFLFLDDCIIYYYISIVPCTLLAFSIGCWKFRFNLVIYK